MESKDNIIYIGEKDRNAYILAAQMQFSRSDDVIIKARGKRIGKAVDIAEMVKRMLSTDSVKIVDENITIGTNSQQNPEKPERPFLVSEIAIVLKKKK
jgi:DNA-binding protein Alba